MNNQASPKQLLQKKQELALLKQQAKELTLKVRRRQYEYNHHYGIAIAGAVLALMFMETKGLTVFYWIYWHWGVFGECNSLGSQPGFKRAPPTERNQGKDNAPQIRNH